MERRCPRFLAVHVADKSPSGQYGESRGPGRGILRSLGARGPGNQDDPSGSSTAGGADSRALEVAVDAAKYTRSEKALEALEWLV